jgi:hypothetical protein
MSDDLLERATRKLRADSEPSRDDLDRTRARVIEGLRADQRRRRRAWMMLVPIAAVFVATTGFAASSGRLDGVVARVRAWAAPERAPRIAEATPRAATEAPMSVPEPPTAIEPPPAAEEPRTGQATSVESALSAPTSSSSSQRTERSAAAKGAEVPKTAAPPANAEDDAGSADLALYRRAHKLHFVDRDYGAALTAWDTYLRDAPNGAFAIEARYNRAIALIKLGRSSEAKSALTPFAEGNVGHGYRQDEARKLLEAL